MNLYIECLNKNKKDPSSAFNAGSKAVNDVTFLLSNTYSSEVNCFKYKKFKSKLKRKISHFINGWFQCYKLFKRERILQYPFGNFWLPLVFLKKFDIILIHDLCGLRYCNKKTEKREIKMLSSCKCVISHNKKMTSYLILKGIDKNKIVELEIFDYLCAPFNIELNRKSHGSILTIAYAGNLDKAPFINQIDVGKINFVIKLYGVGSNFKTNDKIMYVGKEDPDRLPSFLNADLGLVWDGDLEDSDNDALKNYTKFNSPHKLSCYLAAGIPPVVWSKSAAADFVISNHCGYIIDNIYEINNLDLTKYEEIKNKAIEIGKKLQNGYFTKKAFDQAFLITGIAAKKN